MCNKRKVAIVTIYNENNYGNRLQNYAVQKCMEKWGFDSESIVIKKPSSVMSNMKAFAKRIFLFMFDGYAKKYMPGYVRRSNFIKFTRKYVPTRYIESQTSTFPNNIAKEYDMFVVGSDQVWNPCFGDFENLYENMFLTFVPNEKKRCFSPSFGVTEIPLEWKERFKKGLSTFPELCVREKSGVDIIKKMTVKDARVTIDPTLMLDASEWIKIAKKVKDIPESYVLDYFLGEIPSDDLSYKNAVNSSVQKRIRLLDMDDRNIYVSGPAEFVYLISNADLVCTDSFHACVFSILFGKSFIVFKRHDGNKNMLTRIETLLALFDINIEDNIGKKLFIEECKVDKVLSSKRKELQSFFIN